MSSYQSAKVEVERLVEKFSKDYQRFTNPNYNEEQVRVEFINPFFRALGWDVENSLQVVHEDRVIVDDAGEKRVKHPDYGFRTGRDIRFYVEAKKPAVNLQNNPDPAYQVRRYGWSRSLPLSILTDFEEFIIYNCLEKPALNDAPHVARLNYVTYDKYPDAWDDLYGVFSQEAVLDGALERYVDDNKPKGTVTVDTAFLQELERWRELLAKDIAIRNPRLTRRQLNIAVQRTIDRLVFLRITEDRNIEPYGRLNRIAQNRDDVYGELKRLYAEANDKYNSGLFHFTNDDNDEVGDPVSLKIEISGDTLQSIITNLYYPYSPYEFSVLPSDILGQVYERFLGSVIVLDGGSATIEEKPEVRKAGGVYYTPTYIVNYIVENTVGKLVENKNPNQVAELRILDPACGSGSFLIGAYQYLIDWHLDYYVDRIRENPNSTYKNRVRETEDPSQSYALTTDEKKRILLNNIYGVDLDQQAVEVSKLSLLLKMLENETASSTTQYAMFGTDEQLLPDLANNIKWGNSLIGSDFYSGKQIPMFDEEEIYRVKAFDWESREGFGEIMRRGGFDAVIGNPPYVRQEILGHEFKDYAKKKYETYAGTADLYIYFFEQGHNLISNTGLYGVISSNKFMRSNYGKALRLYLTRNTKILQIVDFGELPVFKDAATFPVIVLTTKSDKTSQDFVYAPLKRLDFNSLEDEVDRIGMQLDERSIHGENWNLAPKEVVTILDKIKKNGVELQNYIDTTIYFGLKTGLNAAFVIDEATRNQLVQTDEKNAELIHPYVLGDDIRKYTINYRNRYLILIRKGWTVQKLGAKLPENEAWGWFSEQYPTLSKHLLPFKEKAVKRFDQGDYWWELRTCDYYEQFKKPKILYPDIAKESRIALDVSGLYTTNTIYFIPTSDLYLLGILNSHLMFEYYKYVASVLGDANKGGRLRWFRQDVLRLPIHTIDFEDFDEKSKHNKIVALVQTMLDLHKQLPEASGAQKRAIEQQIARTDREIDILVYELYGLTDEEIAIVEEASQ